MEVRRKRHSGYSPSTGNADSEVRSGSQFDSSQSDYTSSFQARQSMRYEPQPTTSKRLDTINNHSIEDKICHPELQTSISSEAIVTIPFEESLSNVNTDCDRACENGSQDVVMLPLISKQCDDMLDIDGEIFCDSVDSREMYRLEADV